MASRPDSTAVAALNAEILHPAFFCYLDFEDDPVRVTTWPANVTMSGTGDPDLDGFTFTAFDPTVIDISDPRFQEGGSETVTATISGLLLPDAELLNAIADETRWKSRVARLWQAIYNELDVAQGAVWNYYTGRMADVQITGTAESQIIELSIESYLASLSEASGRNYLNAAEFDSGDLSAEASIAIANGGKNATGAAMIGGGGGGGGNVSEIFWPNETVISYR